MTHPRIQGLEELNRQIRSFKQNYMVVEAERLLLDTATKLEGMVRQGSAVSHPKPSCTHLRGGAGIELCRAIQYSRSQHLFFPICSTPLRNTVFPFVWYMTH